MRSEKSSNSSINHWRHGRMMEGFDWNRNRTETSKGKEQRIEIIFLRLLEKEKIIHTIRFLNNTGLTMKNLVSF